MSHNPFIFKQIVKILKDSIDYADATFEVSEKLYEHPKFIELTDTAKEKIEDKTGIHIDRHHEKVAKLNNYPSYNNENVRAFSDADQRTDEQIMKDLHDRQPKNDESALDNFMAIFACIVVWGTILGLIVSAVVN